MSKPQASCEILEKLMSLTVTSMDKQQFENFVEQFKLKYASQYENLLSLTVKTGAYYSIAFWDRNKTTKLCQLCKGESK
jgi:hypothetical protein